ncbi:hypothetical protein RO3G_05314 [Rhizopus delemar RA 99-880]|uniref:Uncharacterized protein n=1 Tax=Rhizopus delemar (strain RA 99-880 / ATCC MYA-4621 / FGSC 9543 / NRRL 43880) TaxID=246409 RepID=I1BWM9_RHIO9|nr:hypothetical protein RO3G_05314 [Rhizopus delemar RA 99-880]|eukprot:EIE80609.1 hypothetical protein RO3G_05314 [Rhizopus delemar RA 99-880]
MCSFRWLYSAGQSWRCLDETAQGQIERLWRCNQANWITSESFPGPVFVDTAQMVLIHKGAFYAIARNDVIFLFYRLAPIFLEPLNHY